MLFRSKEVDTLKALGVDVETNVIIGKTLTIDDALIAFAYGLIVYQSIQFFGNIREVYSIKDEDIIRMVNETPKEIG